MNSRKIFFLFFVFFINQLPGQEASKDTIYKLHNVEVIDIRAKKFNSGFKVNEFEKDILNSFNGKSIADVLISASGVNIKTYGPGGLSSISIRGGSSSHTSVLWNGINIQSPMNGGINLSTIPIDLLEDASIQFGGSGALVGSGSAFGVLRLSSSSALKKEKSVFFSSSLGSFSNYRVALGSKFHINNSLFSIKGFYQDSENNFEFINTNKYGKPRENQTNSAYKQYGFVLDNKTLVNDNLVFLGSVFYQNYNKNIQTKMSDYIPSEANQVDDNLMISTIFKYSKNDINLNIKNALISTGLLFLNPKSPDPKSDNSSFSYIAEIEGNISTKDNQDLNVALNYTYDNASSSGYSNKKFRNRISSIAAYKLSNLWQKINLVFSLREEIVDGKFNPIQYSIGADGNIISFLDFHSNIGRVYRVPTLNDIYWMDSGFAVGNPDLEDEYGWSSDFGISQKINLRKINLSFSQTVFYNYLKNIIVWTPNETGKWKPENENYGRSRGLELEFRAEINVRESVFSLNESYSYTDAETSKNGSKWNKQIYIPKHNSNTILSWKHKKISSNFSINYYSKRFIDKTTTYLDAYIIGDFNISYKIVFKIIDIDLGVSAKNIWDTEYQVSSDYAMPMRNYILTAKFTIN